MSELTSTNPADRDEPAQQGLIPNGNGHTGSSHGLAPVLSTGLFITFEGGEGAGKTTQSTRLAERLQKLGLSVHLTREPGGTELGEQIRSIVKRDSNVDTAAETLLFAAARAQLVKQVIRPRLRRNSIVIVDRFIDSTVAYQGYGRGVDLAQIDAINRTATDGLLPDLTVFLDAEPHTMLNRVNTAPSLFDSEANPSTQRMGDRVGERRFEQEPLSFHEKVRKGYQELAKEGGRWCVVSADQAQHRIADAIWKRVRSLLVDRGVEPDLLFRKQGVHAE